MTNGRQDADAGRRGWHGQELARNEDWISTFTPQELDAIDKALQAFKQSGVGLENMTRAEFPLPTLSQKLAEHMDEIRNGRGFVVLRGLPVLRYSDEDAGAIFYGLGLYLGQPLHQNPRGDLLGHVANQGRKFGEMDVRGYETNAQLPFHTDGCEMVGLLCLRPAFRGGMSSIASSVSVYAEIARQHPAYLKPLADGYPYIRREAAFTEAPVSARISVFGVAEGVISCRCVPTQIEAAAKSLGKPLEGIEKAAIDKVVELTNDPRFRLDMDLQAGDIQLINNYTVMHSRTEYEDYPEPERARHLLRLWLAFDEPWPLPPDFPRQLGYTKGQLAEKHLL